MVNYGVGDETLMPVQALLRDVPEVRELLPEFLDLVTELNGVVDEDNPVNAVIADEFTGWMSNDVTEVYDALRRDFSNSNNGIRSKDEFKWLVKDMRFRISSQNRHASQWSSLFLKKQLLSYARGNMYGVELWRTSVLTMSPVRPLTDPYAQFCALESVAHRHGGVGWHIHPQDSNGKDLGYRMLFDVRRSQDELAWETHGSGYLEWGDPAHKVLPLGTAEDIYWSSLTACRDQSVLAGGKSFKVWASYFAPTSAKTYKAVQRHPNNTFTVPTPKPMKW